MTAVRRASPDAGGTLGPTVVLHVGDDPASSAGGISRVIRDHLERELPGVTAAPVPSYDPVGSGVRGRHGPAVRAARRLVRARGRGATVVHVHLADRGSLVREGGLAVLARALGHRVVVTWHAKDGLERAALPVRAALRVVVAAAHRFTVLSAAHAAVLPRRASVRVVPNDVAPRTDPVPMADRRPAVVFAGEVGTRKGADVLLRAWAARDRPGWSLELFGRVEESERDAIGALAAAPGVTLHGLVDSARVSAALADAAVAALPSRAEALPMFALEAMAAGCAVIGSTAGAMPELLAGGAGVVVPAGDAEALAAALDRVLGSAEERAGLQRTALARIEDGYTPRTVSASWAQLYRDVAGRTAR